MQCPKCREKLTFSENLMGCYDGGAKRCNTGMSCWCCGTWIEVVHVHMPEIPPPDGRFTKSPQFMAACKANGRKSNPIRNRAVVLEHLNSIKYWVLNGASPADCCDKLKAKGVVISRTSLNTHLGAIMKEQVKEVA